MKSYSISQLASIFGLSRSTLLYYDRIGLLRAAKRTDSGYRRYSKHEHDKLERICMFRSTGLPLADIQKILTGDEILTLRVQQQLITAMLKNISSDKFAPAMNKQMWVEMLEAAGMDESAMQHWHTKFEARAPQTHYEFLLSLGISENEAVRIQKWSHKNNASD